jgi:hypothetical protein
MSRAGNIPTGTGAPERQADAASWKLRRVDRRKPRSTQEGLSYLLGLVSLWVRWIGKRRVRRAHQGFRCARHTLPMFCTIEIVDKMCNWRFGKIPTWRCGITGRGRGRAVGRSRWGGTPKVCRGAWSDGASTRLHHALRRTLGVPPCARNQSDGSLAASPLSEGSAWPLPFTSPARSPAPSAGIGSGSGSRF